MRRSQWTYVALPASQLETLASDRTYWRSACKSGVQDFEARRIHELGDKTWSAKNLVHCLQATFSAYLPPDVSLAYWTACLEHLSLTDLWARLARSQNVNGHNDTDIHPTRDTHGVCACVCSGSSAKSCHYGDCGTVRQFVNVRRLSVYHAYLLSVCGAWVAFLQ